VTVRQKSAHRKREAQAFPPEPSAPASEIENYRGFAPVP
jgi:hypothetical protein